MRLLPENPVGREHRSRFAGSLRPEANPPAEGALSAGRSGLGGRRLARPGWTAAGAVRKRARAPIFFSRRRATRRSAAPMRGPNTAGNQASWWSRLPLEDPLMDAKIDYSKYVTPTRFALTIGLVLAIQLLRSAGA